MFTAFQVPHSAHLQWSQFGSTVGNPTAGSRELTSCCRQIYHPQRDAQVFCENCNYWFHTSCVIAQPNLGSRCPDLVDNDYDDLPADTILQYLCKNLPIVRGKDLSWARWKVGGNGECVDRARGYQSETETPTKDHVLNLIPRDSMALGDIFLTCSKLPFYKCRVCHGQM